MSCRATPYRGFKSHRHRRKVNPRLPCKQAEGGGSSFVQSRLVGTCSACRHICFARVPRGGAREARAPREVFHHRCGTPVSLGYTGMAVYLEVCGVPEGVGAEGWRGRGRGRPGATRARLARLVKCFTIAAVHRYRWGTPVWRCTSRFAVYPKGAGAALWGRARA